MKLKGCPFGNTKFKGIQFHSYGKMRPKFNKTWINKCLFFWSISWKSQNLVPILMKLWFLGWNYKILANGGLFWPWTWVFLSIMTWFLLLSHKNHKLAPRFGFFMKLTKKMTCHLFMFYWIFGLILPYEWNCIPLNFVYPKGHPLSFIKNYFY